MSGQARVLIADDEPLALRRVSALLGRHADFAIVAECVDGSEVVEQVREHRPDVVFLDVQMPGINGMSVAKLLQADEAPCVVFITAYDEYAVEAFDVHAIDYLLKPYDEERFVQMLDRVRERLQAARLKDSHDRLLEFVRASEQRPADRNIQVGDLTINVAGRLVRRGQVVVSLRRMEYECLVTMARRPGEIVTRRELLTDVWGYKDDVSSRTLDTHVCELRRKLGHEPSEPGYIETVARVGYRMRCEISEMRFEK